MKDKKLKITCEALHEIFIYFPETGNIINKQTLNLVGTLNKYGYLVTPLDNTIYQIAHIAYCMYYGHYPEKTLDHINRIKDDNRIFNLRDISWSGQAINRSPSKNHPSGIKGVTWSYREKKWQAKITFNKKLYQIGQFKNFINAVKARRYAEKLFGYDKYDLNSEAKQFLDYSKKLIFNTNIEEIVEINIKPRDSIEGEWDFFCLTKKQKFEAMVKENFCK